MRRNLVVAHTKYMDTLILASRPLDDLCSSYYTHLSSCFLPQLAIYSTQNAKVTDKSLHWNCYIPIVAISKVLNNHIYHLTVRFQNAIKIRGLELFKPLFEEIVLFMFELILELTLGPVQRLNVGTHGFSLVLFNEARVTWFFTPFLTLLSNLCKDVFHLSLQGCL